MWGIRIIDKERQLYPTQSELLIWMHSFTDRAEYQHQIPHPSIGNTRQGHSLWFQLGGIIGMCSLVIATVLLPSFPTWSRRERPNQKTRPEGWKAWSSSQSSSMHDEWRPVESKTISFQMMQHLAYRLFLPLIVEYLFISISLNTVIEFFNKRE